MENYEILSIYVSDSFKLCSSQTSGNQGYNRSSQCNHKLNKARAPSILKKLYAAIVLYFMLLLLLCLLLLLAECCG